MVTVVAGWEPDAPGEQYHAWTAAAWDAIKQYGSGVYVNFLLDEGDDRVHEAYLSQNYDRLVSIKRKYDPANLFRFNQNIRPEA